MSKFYDAKLVEKALSQAIMETYELGYAAGLNSDASTPNLIARIRKLGEGIAKLKAEQPVDTGPDYAKMTDVMLLKLVRVRSEAGRAARNFATVELAARHGLIRMTEMLKKA